MKILPDLLAEATRLRRLKTPTTNRMKALAQWGGAASSFAASIVFHLRDWAFLIVAVAFPGSSL